MTPGWGERHPAVAALLAAARPRAAVETAWADGTIPLRISAHPDQATLPDELIVSIRCIVTVGDGVVVCTNADGHRHPWPGGQRQPGESFATTACREVREETGWLLDPTSLRTLGWLHLEHLSPMPADWPYPHPDFLQLVLAGQATSRDGDGSWSDLEGYEVASVLVPLDRLGTELAGELEWPLFAVFVARLGQERQSLRQAEP